MSWLSLLLLLLKLLALVDKDDMRRGDILRFFGSIKCGLATIPSLKSNRLRIASADDDLLLMAMTLAVVVDVELSTPILLDVMVAMI